MAGLLDSNNAAGWAAEGKRLAVDLPEVTAMDAARFIAEATPIIGDAMAAKEVWDEATSENPNWALVGALGGATLLGLIPGVGDAAAKAVKAGARGLLDTAKRVGRRPVGQPDATLDDVFAAIDDMSSVNLVSPDMQKKLTPAPPKIRAYQGTPHKFSAERLVRMPDGSEQYIVGSPDVLPDIPAGAEVLEDFPLGRMRMDKIGTGEGAQVYGHGLYSAEVEDVARVYKDQLSGGASSAGQAKLDRYKGDIDAALNDTLSNLKRLDERELSGDFVGDEKRLEVLRVMHTKVLRQLDDYKTNGVFSSGSMYEIDINADPENFLDWDKTVGSQSQNVKSLLGWTPDAEQAYLSARNADDDMLLSALSADASGQNYTPTKLPIPAGSPPYSATGREIAGKSNLFGSGAQAAEVLRGKGIPGIKYLDADSRSAGQGSRNYVVFDEKLINIVKRYGVAGAAAMLGVAAMDVEQAMAQGVQQPSGLLTPDMINSQQANQRPYNAGLLQ